MEFKKAIETMVEIGGRFLQDQISAYSKLNQTEDRDAREEMEKLRYNEIGAMAHMVRIFTGREISFQWTKGINGERIGGFRLFEIMPDVPFDKTPMGVSKYKDRYGVEEKRIRWGEGVEQGKIVCLYEKMFDRTQNPAYTEMYHTEELTN